MYRVDEEDANLPQACVLVLDADRRLLQLSPGAARVLAACRSLRVDHDTLCAASTKAGARLAAAFRGVLAGERVADTVCIEGVIDITMVLVEGRNGVRRIVATVRQIAQSRAAHLGQAARRFGLTPAEERLLDILCDGASVPQAAVRLGVAPTTARTHLQRIFDKSGARRQSDLQRLIFSPVAAG